MAFAVAGYDGNLTETDYAPIEGLGAGVAFCVAKLGDCRVTGSSSDRTVTVAAGTVFCGGVKATTAAPISIQSPALTTSSRWDLIAVLFDWTTPSPGGSASVVVVQGTASQALPSSRFTNLGVQYHVPLALVQYTSGSNLPAQIIDLTVWRNGGVLQYANDTARTVLATDGLLDSRSPSGAASLAAMQRIAFGATNAPTPGTTVVRDGAGRFQATAPQLGGDVATLDWVNAQIAAGGSTGSGSGTATAAGTPVAWTPTWGADSTAPTNYTATGTYVRIGQLVYYDATLVASNAFNGGTGTWLFSLPFPIATTPNPKPGIQGIGLCYPSSGAKVPFEVSVSSWTNGTVRPVRTYDGTFLNSPIPGGVTYGPGTAIYYSGQYVAPPLSTT